VQALDVPVGLRAPEANLWVRDAVGRAARELAAAELVAVVGEHAFRAPAGLLRFGGDPAGKCRGLLDGRARRRADDQTGPPERAVGAIAVICQTVPRALQAPTKKQSRPTTSPGRLVSMCGSGAGSRGASCAAREPATSARRLARVFRP
jgi:hypothetical protein